MVESVWIHSCAHHVRVVRGACGCGYMGVGAGVRMLGSWWVRGVGVVGS